MSSAEADRDKNQVVTAAEAFEFASRKVADTFKANAALATEHARLEGDNAGRFIVARLGEAALVSDDATLNALLLEQADIEQRLEQVKSTKASIEPDRYYDELEKVLLALARLDRRIDERRAMLGPATSRQTNAPQTH